MDISLTIEIEKKLLSSLMLCEGEAIPKVSPIINADDFYRPEHKRIYAALLRLNDNGVPLDILAVENELERSNELKYVTHSYLFGLLNLEYTTARAEYYAGVVKKMSQLRRIVELGREITDNATYERRTPEEIMAYAEENFAATVKTKESAIESVQEIAVSAYCDLGKQTPGMQGLTTGFWDLNKLTGGLRKSDLIILAARPSMGKTALALNIATAASKVGTVLMFSLEMSKKQLAQRLLSSLSGVEATRIQNSTLTQEEVNKVAGGLESVDNLKLFIDDTGALSLFELKQTARRVKREHGLELIVIDYIQLMQGSKEYRGNRVQEVSELSRGLKALARELDVPILALSQLSRAVELRADKKPQLSDLRESGSIEQDADIVMFLYREEYYDRENADVQKLAEVIVAKNRNGATGTVPLHFKREILLFRNLTRKADD